MKGHVTSLPLLSGIIIVVFFSSSLISADSHAAATTPDWIHTRDRNIEKLSPQDGDSPAMNQFARNLLSQQALSGKPSEQLQAVRGIASLLEKNRITANNQTAVNILFSVAGQSFQRHDRPPVHPFTAQIEAIQQLGNMGDAADRYLLQILRYEENPSIAASAAMEMSHVGQAQNGQIILTRRLRLNRTTTMDQRLTRSLLNLVLREALLRPLDESLVQEVIYHAYGSGTRNERQLALEILTLVSE